MALRIKPLLARILLRGALLKAWTLLKYRRLDRAYCKELVRVSRLARPQEVRPSLLASNPLRTILVIADCMWEQDQLVPDLRKRWEVTLLDLHPLLQSKPTPELEATCVRDGIRGFAEARKHLTPDVILLYARGSLLSDELFDDLRKRWKCPIFGMNLDDKTTFFPYRIFSGGSDNYQRWSAKFDLNLSSSLAAVDWYHEQGFSCLYCPPGVHLPANLPPPDSADFKYLFSFVGSSRVDRAAIMRRLRRLDIPIALFGSGWPDSKWTESPVSIYRTSQLNLGVGFCTGTQTQTMLKGRDFECPGVGACYLTTYNWELERHWEVGKEILCYRSVEELVEVYSYYKKRPEECLRIAQAAYRRAAAEHTWEKRFLKIFRETGFKV